MTTNIIAPCPQCASLDNLVVETQEQDLWCWAAVAQAIDHFHHSDSVLTQCQIASRQQGAGACCIDPLADTCNRRWFLEKALCTVGCLDQGPIPVPSTFSFSNLKALIQPQNNPPGPNAPPASLKPVGARIEWLGLGGHFVVIKGFLEEKQMLLIADPIFGERLVSFDEFRSTYLLFGIWTHYYLTDEVNHENCI